MPKGLSANRRYNRHADYHSTASVFISAAAIAIYFLTISLPCSQAIVDAGPSASQNWFVESSHVTVPRHHLRNARFLSSVTTIAMDRVEKRRVSPGPDELSSGDHFSIKQRLRQFLEWLSTSSYWWPLRLAVNIVIEVIIDGQPTPVSYTQHIMGGQEVRVRQKFPYMARLNMTFTQGPPSSAGNTSPRFSTCGGALVHTRWVITAAHCLYASVQEIASKVQVTLGDLHVGDSEPGEVSMTALGVDVHPNFQLETLAYDIALIRLPKNAPLSDNIGLIELPTENLVPTGKRATTSGWGVKDGGRSTHVNTLRTTDLKILEPRECVRKWVTAGGQSEDIQDFNICYGGDGAGACFGDSGGPVIVRVPTQNPQRETTAALTSISEQSENMNTSNILPASDQLRSMAGSTDETHKEILVAVNSFVLAEMAKQKWTFGYVRTCRQDAPNVGTDIRSVLGFIKDVFKKWNTTS